MKKLLLLAVLLIILSGCAIGVYDGRNGFAGAVIGVPYPAYHSHGYYDGPAYRSYPYPPGRYYRGPGYYR